MTFFGKPAPRALIAVLCTAIQMCLGTVYAWSYFQTLLVRELDWSHTQTAVAFSITIFSLGMAAALGGAMLSRHGPRKLAVIGSIMFCGGYFIASLSLVIESLALFYLGFGVIGGIGIGLGYVTPVATVAKWFPDRKGLATGIVVMGFGVGALVLSTALAPVLLLQAQGDLALMFLLLGSVFAVILIPSSLMLDDPPADAPFAKAAARQMEDLEDAPLKACLMSSEFAVMWIVFFFNIAAGIAVISFQSSLLQEVWGLADPTIEPSLLATYGATLIAVSSLCNGLGRLFWGLLSDRIGRVRVFRILLASQMFVFGVLMTEQNPWVFSALVCYIMLCFGGGFATMPSFVQDVFGARRMATIYGAVLSAWAMAGIFGPVYVGYLKDQYPDRAVIYCFLIGILILGLGYLFTYLLNDDRIRVGKPTVQSTARQFGLPPYQAQAARAEAG